MTCHYYCYQPNSPINGREWNGMANVFFFLIHRLPAAEETETPKKIKYESDNIGIVGGFPNPGLLSLRGSTKGY